MYKVHSISKETEGTDEVFESPIYNEALEYCLERLEDENNNYVIYDAEGVILYDTGIKNMGNYGVMGC